MKVAVVLVALSALAWPPPAVLTRGRPGREARFGGSWLQRSNPEEECLAVLDAVVALLRAGSPATPALWQASEHFAQGRGRTASGWQRLREVARADGDVVGTWRELGREWGADCFEAVARAWGLSQRQGCPLADAVAGAASGVRASRAHRAAVDAATAGAKATMGVLLLLPALGAALAVLLGVNLLEVYGGASGFVTLWPGLALMWIGRRWANRLVAGALKS